MNAPQRQQQQPTEEYSESAYRQQPGGGPQAIESQSYQDQYADYDQQAHESLGQPALTEDGTAADGNVQLSQRPPQQPVHDEQIVPAHMQGKIIDFATADDTTFDMNQGRKVFKPEELLTTDGADGEEEDPANLKVQNLPQS